MCCLAFVTASHIQDVPAPLGRNSEHPAPRTHESESVESVGLSVSCWSADTTIFYDLPCTTWISGRSSSTLWRPQSRLSGFNRGKRCATIQLEAGPLGCSSPIRRAPSRRLPDPRASCTTSRHCDFCATDSMWSTRATTSTGMVSFACRDSSGGSTSPMDRSAPQRWPLPRMTLYLLWKRSEMYV